VFHSARIGYEHSSPGGRLPATVANEKSRDSDQHEVADHVWTLTEIAGLLD
jgi:hypothetical protein